MTSTFYDRRAERRVATGMAQQHEAEAEARRAETELRLVEVSERRDALARQRVERARADRVERRAARWAALRSAAGSLRARLGATVPFLLGGIAMGAPIVIGWNGQLQTARSVLHLGVLAWIFPVALEGGAWWLAYLTHRAVRQGLPTTRLRAWTWVLAATAAGMNFWHGASAYSPLGGTGLALASLLGIALWDITTRHERQHVDGRSAAQVRAAWFRCLRFPRLSWAARSIAAARGTAEFEDAWRAAWIDRFGVGPDATRRDRRLARVVRRNRWQADKAAARRGELMLVSGVILRRLSTPCTEDGSGETRRTPREMRKLSARGSALLGKTRAAISEGTLPETPSAKAIRRHFGGGMETAIEVRDALSGRKEVN